MPGETPVGTGNKERRLSTTHWRRMTGDGAEGIGDGDDLAELVVLVAGHRARGPVVAMVWPAASHLRRVVAPVGSVNTVVLPTGGERAAPIRAVRLDHDVRHAVFAIDGNGLRAIGVGQAL